MNAVDSTTLDPIFDALSSEHRRRIVSILAAGPTDTPALGRRFDLTKQALNRHLTVLEQAGLVERELQGRVHRLELVDEPLNQVTDWVSQIRRGWEANLDRLEQLLDDTNPN